MDRRGALAPDLPYVRASHFDLQGGMNATDDLGGGRAAHYSGGGTIDRQGPRDVFRSDDQGNSVLRSKPDDWVYKAPYGSTRFNERQWTMLDDGKGAVSYGIDTLDVINANRANNGSVTVGVIARHGAKASIPGGIAILKIQFLCAKKQERTIETFTRMPDGTEETTPHANETYRQIASGTVMEHALQVACRLK